MKAFVGGFIAAMLLACGPASACSPGELVSKQKAYSDAVKVALERDPSGEDARKAQAMVVIGRYSGLKAGTNGSYIIDMLCKENDELFAIYK
jgi:hypothetical protein